MIVVKDGRIMEEGTHDELMNKHGEYAKMFAVQSHYYQKNLENNEEELCYEG